MVVFKDARKDNAINGIMASIFGASGQSCIAGSRLYLQEDIYNEYLEELKSRVEGFKIGDPLSTTTQLGPLAPNILAIIPFIALFLRASLKTTTGLFPPSSRDI